MIFMSSRLCSGASQVSGQPGLPQRTTMWPPRAFSAGGQSHGSQSIVTRPGAHGCRERHCSGISGKLTCSTPVFKHAVELAGTPAGLETAGRARPRSSLTVTEVAYLRPWLQTGWVVAWLDNPPGDLAVLQ